MFTVMLWIRCFCLSRRMPAVACLLVSVWAISAAACAHASEPPWVLLSKAPGSVSLVGKVGFFEDTEAGDLGIDDVRTPQVDAAFTVPQFAVKQSSLKLHVNWFKIRLRQTDAMGEWLIDSGSSSLQHFSAYGPFDASGRALAAPLVRNITEPPDQPSLEGDRLTYRFRLDQAGDYTVYLRTVSYFPESYRLSVWDAIQFGQAEQGRSLFNGLCYGLLVGMLIYNLMLLFVFREPLYAYNFLSCLFAMCTLVIANGHAVRYLPGNALSWIPIALVVAPLLWIVFAALFGLSFLELVRYAPRIRRCVLVISTICVAAAVLAFLGPSVSSLVQSTIQAASLVAPPLMFAGAVIALRSGFRPAAWYLAGLSVLMLAAIGSTLNDLGLLNLPFRYESLQVGAVVEISVFVMALGSRIRRLRELNGELGLRTKQLTRAAQTDPLTGLFNRAGWTHYGPRVLAQGGRAALLLIDLDKFKPVNDVHGHAAGDKLLVSVARRLLADVRAQGIVARLGGDEFVVLLADAPDTAALGTHVQRLIRLISQPVLHQGTALQVGASIGIACYPADGENLAALMHAADVAMYLAKERGRDGYAFSTDAGAEARVRA